MKLPLEDFFNDIYKVDSYIRAKILSIVILVAIVVVVCLVFAKIFVWLGWDNLSEVFLATLPLVFMASFIVLAGVWLLHGKSKNK
jgi:hypothetical protein